MKEPDARDLRARTKAFALRIIVSIHRCQRLPKLKCLVSNYCEAAHLLGRTIERQHVRDLRPSLLVKSKPDFKN